MGSRNSSRALEDLEGFLREVDKVSDIDAMANILRKQMDRHGFEFFSYQLLLPPNGPRIPLYLTSFKKEWTFRYVQQKYVRDDLVSRHAAMAIVPFLWDQIIDYRFYTPTQKRMFHEGAEFGLRAGGSVPLHGPGAAKALFTVASDVSEERFAKQFLGQRHLLQIVGHYVHDRLLKLGLHNPPSPSMFKPTPRETEILTWCANGKTNSEIAAILSLSPHTIKEHMISACRKLNTTNKTHATAVAILHGLITP